jgi:hypothetical protein
MVSVARLAIDKRAAGTIWITQPRRDPDLGPVFDVLPPYWDEEVAFFRRLAEDEQAFKDVQDKPKEDKEKEDKEGKEDKEDKEKEDKEDKEKEDKEKESKEEPKDKSEDKEDKENKDEKDEKERKDDKDLHGDVFLKDSEALFKTLETSFAPPRVGDESPDGPPGEPVVTQPALGRTFIRADERPAVGERIVADPDPDPETDSGDAADGAS